MSDHSPQYFTLTPAELAGYKIDTDEAPKPDKRERQPADKFSVPEIKESLVDLKQALADRAAEFGLSSPQLDLPPLPPDFSREHLAIFEQFLGDNLGASAVPEVKNWGEYFKMMYPASKKPSDEQKGLVSHLPDWWNNDADVSVVGGREKWSASFTRSITTDAEALKGQLFLTEAIQKPNFINGSQQYGTKEGRDNTKDYLLPIIQEIFGDNKNRFNLNWDQVNQVAARVKEKIVTELNDRHLPVIDFDIQITPAIVANMEMTLRHPENSTTNTFEWCSTPLLKQDDTDSGFRLLVGRSGRGGAGFVNFGPRDLAWFSRGFRLSVVLKNT